MTLLQRMARATFSSQSTAEPRQRLGLRRWFLAGASASYAYYLYENYSDAKQKEATTGIPAHKLAVYRWLPVNAMTRLAGKMAVVEIPEALRQPVFGLYSMAFGCDLGEAELPSAKDYSTFQSFFTRKLQNGSRPIDASADLVSPADGRILSMGRIEVPLAVESGQPLVFPEQIKGISYPLKDLVPKPVFDRLTRTSKPIHYCTIYLSPGDYHRFHSPATWTQQGEPARIQGEVLSVAPYMMRWVRNLLCLNERTVIGGTWRHGAFTMIPVGATNVSTIELEPKADAVSAKYEKGEPVGTFKLGSTVVLLFHAPETFKWSPEAVGGKIKMGQPLGTVPRSYRFINGLF